MIMYWLTRLDAWALQIIMCFSCLSLAMLGSTNAEAHFNTTVESGPLETSTHNRTKIVDNNTLVPCPEKCSCTDKGMKLRCDARNFTIVPTILNLQVELLNLSANQIAVLSNHSFRLLDSLSRLHLEQNLISLMHPQAFQDLSHLCMLYLHHNLLHAIPPRVFSPLYNLTTLDISHNLLHALPAELFLNSSSLQHLNLSRNNFSSIPKETFQHTPALSQLDLSQNPVTEIQKDSFVMLQKLQTLNLQGTRVKTLDPGLYISLQHLQTLNLAHSGLTEVNMSALQANLPSLRVFDLSGVVLQCSCKLSDLHRWMTNHNSPAGSSPVCSRPKSLQGKVLSQLPLEMLVCPVETARSLAINPTTKTHTVPMGMGYTRSEGAVPYDPLLGWYTAATLGGMLIVFLLCLGMDKLKRQCYKYENTRRRHRNQIFYRHKIRTEGRHNEAVSPLQEEARPVVLPPTLVLPELQVDSEPLVSNAADPDYVYLTPRPETTPLAQCNQCPSNSPQKLVNKEASPCPAALTNSPRPSLQAAADVKFKILEINPECPLHSSKGKGRGPGAASTDETTC